MAHSGEQKKSIEHHIAVGNYRPSRHGNALLPVEVPPAPADLAPKAQAFWNVVTEELRRAGLISFCDGKMLRLAADSWEIYWLAMDDITERGILNDKRTALNPAVKARDNAWKQLVTVLAKFGMAPAARTGLRVSNEQGEHSEEERVASILQIRKA